MRLRGKPCRRSFPATGSLAHLARNHQPGGLEGRRGPLVERLGGLHIVVRIDQDCRLRSCMQPVAIDQRMAGGRDAFAVLEADAPQLRGHEGGGALDVRLVLRQRADAGNTQQLLELFQKALLVLLGECDCGGSHVEGPFRRLGHLLILPAIISPAPPRISAALMSGETVSLCFVSTPNFTPPAEKPSRSVCGMGTTRESTPSAANKRPIQKRTFMGRKLLRQRSKQLIVSDYVRWV